MARMSFAIGGGKGGTGKSLVSCNLAVAMAQAGHRVILIDADLGAANVHTMFGVDRPPLLLEHFIARKVERLDQVLIDTQLPSLKLICGGMPLPGTANPKFTQKMRLIRHINNLDADVIISDIGAGVGFNVLDLFNAAQVKVAVFTSQLTSVHNGYGFLKAAIHRHLQRTIDVEARTYLASAGPEAGDESMADMLTRLSDFSVDQAENARRALSDYQAYLVGNMLTSIREGYVINAVSQMVRDHLHIQAPVLGLLRQGEKMKRSVNERRPFMLTAGIESNAELFRKMAGTLLSSAAEAWTKNQERLVTKAIQEKVYERKNPRFKVNLHAVMFLEGGPRKCRIKDLSEGGVGLVFEEPLDQTADGKLVIRVSSVGKEIVLEVRERHRGKEDMRIGCSFHCLSDEQKISVTKLVADVAAATATSMNDSDSKAPPQVTSTS